MEPQERKLPLHGDLLTEEYTAGFFFIMTRREMVLEPDQGHDTIPIYEVPDSLKSSKETDFLVQR